MSYFVYILRCRGGCLYTGITTDPRRRLEEHLAGVAAGGAKFTASHPPLGMAALWQAEDRSAASRLESRIKALPRPAKDALIAGTPPKGWDMTGYLPVPVIQLEK